jgi:enoyl-CoA hydratase
MDDMSQIVSSANSTVQMQRIESVLVITIQRPEVKNAIDRVTSEALAHAMDTLDTDPELVLGILTGAGGHFCSGMDLKAFLRGERVELPGRGLAGMVQTPPRKPLIAAIEGYALAGGFEIALACDLIVASETAQMGIPEVKRGLIAGSGGLLRLPRRIPPAIAMELALTGDLIHAPQAHQWGLVNRLVAPGEALQAALELAKRIATNGPMAVRITKQLINEAPSLPADEVWTRQNALLEQVIASDDAREGAAAFAQKRPPH